MKYLQTYISSICWVFTTAVFGSQTTVIMQPSTWIHTYLCDTDGTLAIPRRDLQVLLNLFYLSFDRSRITLEASEDGLRALRAPWQAFQNIIQLRRNPSKYAPYILDKNSYADDLNLLYDLHLEHYRIGKTYAVAIETIMHGSLITNEQVKQGVHVLREDARKAIAESLTNVQEYLDAIINLQTGKAPTKESAFHPNYAYLLQKNFSLGDYIWALMPNMALNSFVKADDLTISISEEWWKALYQLLLISNIVWKPIEQARASLYLSYYKALYREAQTQDIDMQSMMLMFDENGLLEAPAQCTPLPDPKNLQVPNRTYNFPPL